MPGGAGRLEGDLALPDARGLKAGRAEGSGRSPPDSTHRVSSEPGGVQFEEPGGRREMVPRSRWKDGADQG